MVQGHALFTRHAGSNLPCPLVNITGGFNQFLAAAYNLSSNTTEAIVARFGAPFGKPLQHSPELTMRITMTPCCLTMCWLLCHDWGVKPCGHQPTVFSIFDAAQAMLLNADCNWDLRCLGVCRPLPQ